MQSFIQFLRAIDLRVFQEREVGLDVYLSGLWALVPLALAGAAATVFFLSIFKAIPVRKHAIALLLGAGILAFAAGLGGTFLRFRQASRPDAPPRVLVEGKGRDPAEKPGYREGLLAIPLLIGGATLAGGAGGSLFLLIFWGKDGPKKKERARG